jgi:tetratricopeptide (TPR) repeat protein
LELSPNFAYGYSVYGRALLKQQKKEDAIQNFEKALEIESSQQDALFELLTLYAYDEKNRSNYIKCLKTYDKHYGLTSRNNINVLGNHYLAEGNYHLALSYYKKILNIKDYPYGYHNSAIAYWSMSQLLNAIDTFAINIKLNPDYKDSKEEFTKHLPQLEELEKIIPSNKRNILSKSDWYENYINPFHLLEIQDDEIDHLDSRLIQAYRKKLLQEIDLEDGKISWLDDKTIDKSRAIGVCDELSDDISYNFHLRVFKYKPLLNFLSKGNIELFLAKPTDDLIDLKIDLTLNNELVKCFDRFFPKQFDFVFKKIIDIDDFNIYKAVLSGRMFVSDDHIDECFTNSKSAIHDLLEPLRNENKSSEKTKPSLAKIKALTTEINLPEKIKALPIQFIELQEEATTVIRSIAINVMNNHDDSETSKAILELSKLFTFYKSSLRQKLDEDSDQINKIIAKEKENESVLTFGEKESSIKKEGIRHNNLFIPTAEVESLRWGLTYTRANYITTCSFKIIVTGENEVINISWKSGSDVEKQRKLFNDHVNALIHFIFPSVMEKINSKLSSGKNVKIGPCSLTKDGIEFETKGWFSTKSHSTPWDFVQARLESGMLYITSSVSPSAKCEMSLEETDKAFALYILASKDKD